MQTGRNVQVNYKEEDTFNTPPGTVTGATQFRPNSGSGLTLSRAVINPGEIRSDGKTPMGRLGSKSVAGSYSADLSVGTFDALIEAVMRSTWVDAVTIDESDVTSVTTQIDGITGASGSWISLGVKVGDVVRLTNHSTPANNDKNLRVTGVTASKISVPSGDLTLNATPDTAVTLTISRKLIQGTTPVRRSFTFEEYDADIDQSEQATGVRVSSMKLTGQPDGMALVEFGLVGADLTPLATAASPFFTSPTLSSTIGLTFVDATIRVDGVDVATPTAFEMTLDMTAKGQPVIGSVTTPDIFENNSTLSGSVSMIRGDLTNLTKFTDETEFELHILLTEPESEPKDFISVFVPRVKLSGVNKNFGGDGAMIEQLPFFCGTKGSTSGYDDTSLSICTSAA